MIYKRKNQIAFDLFLQTIIGYKTQYVLLSSINAKKNNYSYVF